ncbi:hypothetical protein HPP92_025062 [Vanilla planifolia]|uniref:Uncharacterized protein n=1 Tax=Vanilla planifolia TaxID=51239 RepID=A0A835PGU7_VANPL|nr:hypothetical protein HPP92_025062 [Vanilla planifolia]
MKPLAMLALLSLHFFLYICLIVCCRKRALLSQSEEGSNIKRHASCFEYNASHPTLTKCKIFPTPRKPRTPNTIPESQQHNKLVLNQVTRSPLFKFPRPHAHKTPSPRFATAAEEKGLMGKKRVICCLILFLLLLHLAAGRHHDGALEKYGRLGGRGGVGLGSSLSKAGVGRKAKEVELYDEEKRIVYTGPNPLHN